MFGFKHLTIDQGNKVNAGMPCLTWLKGDIKEQGVAERVMIILLKWINEMSQLQLQSNSQERAA
jgi:hypothetical protein